MKQDTVYTEIANGRREYWTYSDGEIVRVGESWVKHELARKTIKLIYVE